MRHGTTNSRVSGLIPIDPLGPNWTKDYGKGTRASTSGVGRNNMIKRIAGLPQLIALGLVCSVMALGLTGCVEPPAEETTTASKDSKTEAKSEYRDRLIIAVPADAQKLDPVQARDFESAQVLMLTCETLLTFAERSTEIVPGLAESYTIEDEGKTWRFKLREGVTFHDGTPFNAKAVKYNLDRFLAKDASEHPNYVPDMPYRASLYEGIVGSVEAPSEHEVIIRLERPFVAFAANLACFPSSIISPTALKKEGPAIVAQPIGTGPYRLNKWVRNSEMHLVAFDKYWGEKPKTPNIYFKVLNDSNQLLNALMIGDADIINGVSTKYLPTLESKDGIVVHRKPALNIGYVGINNELEKFKDKRVRQAINYAIDKEYICEKLHDGASIPARGALPPGMMGALKEPVYPFDPDKARELLADAGHGPDNPLQVELLSYDAPRPYNMAGIKLSVVLEQNLKDVGIEVENKVVDFAKFLSDRSNGSYEIGYIGWGSDNGDPDNTIYELFGANPNNLRWYDETARQIMLDAQVEADPEKRRVLYEKANRYVIEEAPVAFVNHSTQIMASRDNVEGFELNPMALHRYNSVRVKE
jgi:ABC-type transport system substrate-binding protein